MLVLCEFLHCPLHKDFVIGFLSFFAQSYRQHLPESIEFYLFRACNDTNCVNQKPQNTKFLKILPDKIISKCQI